MNTNTHTKTIIAVVGVCMGIILGEKFNFGSEIAIASLFIFIAQAAIYFLGKRKSETARDTVRSILRGTEETFEKKSGSEVALVSLLFFGAVFLGMIRMQFVSEVSRFVCDSPCTFIAQVIQEPTSHDVYQVVDVVPVISVDETRQNMMNIRLKMPLYPKIHLGESLSLTGKVTVPKNIYPHKDAKSFDYKTYLMTKNIGSEMFYPHSEVVRSATTKTFTEELMSLKEELIARINTYISQPVGALAGGMLLGDDSMSKNLTQTFRVSGLSHIVVLSGFNIAILISSLFLILKFLPLLFRIIVVSVIVCLFVLMVGAEASVVRATIMAFVALLALLLGRGYVAHQTLILSFLCIIFYTPSALLHDVSLHLSFLATLGIVYMSERVKKFIEQYLTHSFFDRFGYHEIIATTLCAYVATLPYLMYTFGTISIYGLLTNLLVLPLVPIVMLLTFIVVLMSFISLPLSYAFGYITTLGGGYIILVAQMTEALPYSSITHNITLLSMLMMYLCIGICSIFFIRNKQDETRVTKHGEILSEVISY